MDIAVFLAKRAYLIKWAFLFFLKLLSFVSINPYRRLA